ncbi:MAG: TA system VapC family ribonuclease toxin [Bacteroidales bacterium]
MSAEALLDINVLVALFDPDHVHHDLAHDWFADQGARAWATCPLTENGFVRVVSNPAYASPLHRVEELAARLRRFCRQPGHRFWPDDVSLLDEQLFDLSVLGSPRHVTDVYLLGLAKKNNGRLVTFDRAIPRKAVRGAGLSTLEVITPAESD